MPNAVSDSTAAPDVVRRATQLVRACLGVLVIMSGLTLRRYGFGIGLPGFVVKYGGSALWGTMLFMLLGTAAPSLNKKGLAVIALVVAICVELFRLVHTPSLDAFRLSTLGALLLGRIFSPWNVFAYAAGIWASMALDQFVLTKLGVARPKVGQSAS